MFALSSLCFVGAFAFAMTVGPQTRPWTWGPAMTCLALALILALPRLYREKTRLPGLFTIVISFATIGWFTARILQSPVAELALADLLLLASAVGSFCWVRVMDGNVTAQRIFHWGVATLLTANLIAIYQQWKHPGFIPLFDSIPVESGRTGFFTHYIEAANFLVITSIWTAAAAVWGPHSRLTRILFGLIAIAGLVAVTMSGGRGGVVGGSAACLAFFGMMLLQAKKRDAKWFAPAVIAVPILVAGAICYLLFGWSAAVKARTMKDQDFDLITQLDNDARLLAIGIAWDCIADHPVQGGGARSFSWEAFRYSDGKSLGDMTTHRLEYAHNEFLQASADYGIIGVLLVCLLITCFVLNAVNFTLFAPSHGPPDPTDALRLGGFAALAGLLAQACFSFIFHLIPGVLLLGTSLGMMYMTARSKRDLHPRMVPKITISVPLFVAITILSIYGFKGTIATNILWKSEYGKSKALYSGSRIDNLTNATKWWSHSSIHGLKGSLFQEMAGKPGDAEFITNANAALEHYLKASKLHPFEPTFAINTANLLSNLENDEDAETWYDKAIDLQATQEPAFRAHLSCATHYLRKGIKISQKDGINHGLSSFERAAKEIRLNVEKMHWLNPEIQHLRLIIHDYLGMSREASGDLEGAMQAYIDATELHNGRGVFFRVARLQGKMAQEVWQQREPEKALALFLKAKASIDQCRNELPIGVTKEERWKYTSYLEKTIRFLQNAKVTPAP